VAGETWCWGTILDEQDLDRPSSLQAPHHVALFDRFEDLTADFHGHVCGLRRGEGITCLGSSEAPFHGIWPILNTERVTQLADGAGDVNAAIESDGSLVYWAWGHRVDASRDAGCTFSSQSVRDYMLHAQPLSRGPFVQVASTGAGSCALTAEGVVSCFGVNLENGFGPYLGTNGPIACMPEGVSGLEGVEARTILSSTCVLSNIGRLHGWGWQEYVASPPQPTAFVPLAMDVGFPRLREACGFQVTECGVADDATVWCRGWLPMGDETAHRTPFRIEGLS
jgi:hypothetical protein